MPYKLRKAPKKELYWVVTIETGKKHSKDPIPKDKAKAQKRILEKALRGNGIVMSGLEAMGLVEPPLTQAQIAQLQTAVANELFNFIRAGNELTVESMKAILYLCIDEAGINNDISVEEENIIMDGALLRAQEQVRVIQQQQAEEFHRQNQEQIRLQAQELQGVKVLNKAQKSQQKFQKKAQQKAQKQQFKKGRGLKGGNKWKEIRLIAEGIKKAKKRNETRFRAVTQASGPVNPRHIGPVRGSEVRELEPIPDIVKELNKLVYIGFIKQEDVEYYKEKLEEYLALRPYEQSTFQVRDPIPARDPELALRKALGYPPSQSPKSRESGEEGLQRLYASPP